MIKLNNEFFSFSQNHKYFSLCPLWPLCEIFFFHSSFISRISYVSHREHKEHKDFFPL